MATLTQLAETASAAIRRGSRTEDIGERARSYRLAAETLVEARSRFLDDDGEPDWRGKTYDYRVWYGDVLGDASVPMGERAQVQAAIRYHVGNILRERLDAETLGRLGLRAPSPRERNALQRAERSALLKSFTGSSSGFVGMDALRALTSAVSLLERVDAAALRDLDEAGRAEARRLVSAASEAVRVLTRKVPRS